jgi:hypothetical protein
LLLIKTRKELFEKLERTIKRTHPYAVPEIIGLRIEKGSRPYLGWITKETPLGTKKMVRYCARAHPFQEGRRDGLAAHGVHDKGC